jgi:hypothetical protein
VFARNIGSIRALAAGDFTVNMGQGLIQWQSLAFKKSGEVMNIKRQSPVLRPYNSAGEFNFHRGAGITIHKGRLDATVFFSFRKLSAGITIDTVTKNDFFTSFQTSGYHRTINEMEDRNRLGQQAAGTTISYDHERLHIGINGVLYRFSLPLQKRDEPYNLFAISGKSWYNASIDYSYTWKNCHFFGEAAIDRNFHRATLNGLLISISSKADVSLLHRVLSMQYQAVNGNAFTENTSPSNENGWYAGLTIRPSSAWLWDAYMDVYRFPWLKYQADAPSSGRDFLVQVIYTPSRKTEMYIRYKNEIRQADMPGNVAMHSLTFYSRQNCRVQINYSIDPAITVRTRTEMTWFEKKENDASTGFLFYTDIFYRPPLNKYSGSIRFQYFEADSYDARLYAYENNVPYSYSVLVFSGKGYRYYLILNYELSKKISCSMRWSRTIYGNSEEPLYGPGLINRSESEMKFQLQLII